MTEFQHGARPTRLSLTVTDAQVKELRQWMLGTGQLPLPGDIPKLPPEALKASIMALEDALADAAAVGDAAPEGTALAHFASGLLYAQAILDSCQRLESDPAGSLALLATWAARLTRELLAGTRVLEAQTDELLEAIGDDPDLLPTVLAQMPHALAFGNLLAALSVFHAAVFSLTVFDPEKVTALFDQATAELSGAPFGEK